MQPRYNSDISVREDRDNYFTNNSHSHDGNHELVAPSQSSNVPTTIKKSIPIKLSSIDDSSRNRSPELHGNTSHKSSTENAFAKSPRNSPTSRTLSPNNSSPIPGGSPTSSTTILSNSTATTTSNNSVTTPKSSEDTNTMEMRLEPKSLGEQNESGSFPSSPTISNPTKPSIISPSRTQLQVVNVALGLNSDNNMSLVEDENLQIHSIGTKLSKPNDSKYPIIHICPSCNMPIAVFARLVPCQHMCCYPCSKASSTCYLCSSKITDVANITHDPTIPGGGIFVCQQDNCKRSYLSEYSLTEHQRLRAHGPYQGITPAVTTSNTSTTSSKSYSQSHSKSNNTGNSSHSYSSSKQTASPPSPMEIDKHSHTYPKSHSQTIRSNSERDSHDSKRRPNNEPNLNHNNYPKNIGPMDYYAHPDNRTSNRGNRSSNFNKQPHKQHDPRYNPYY